MSALYPTLSWDTEVNWTPFLLELNDFHKTHDTSLSLFIATHNTQKWSTWFDLWLFKTYCSLRGEVKAEQDNMSLAHFPKSCLVAFHSHLIGNTCACLSADEEIILGAIKQSLANKQMQSSSVLQLLFARLLGSLDARGHFKNTVHVPCSVVNARS